MILVASADHRPPRGLAEARIEFTPPIDASIRQTTGLNARGKLVSLTAKTLMIEGSRGTDIPISVSQIRSIKTNDGQFSYVPDEESFSSLIDRAETIPGVKVVRPSIAETPPPDSAAQAPVTSEAARVPPPERDGESPIQGDDESPQPAPESSAAADAINDDADAPPGTTILSCSHCNKDLSASIRDGDRCPHCGIILSTLPPPALAASAYPTAQNSRPGAAYPSAGYPAASAPGNAAAPAVAGADAPASGFSAADAPIWMKAGFFVGMLALAWFVLQRR